MGSAVSRKERKEVPEWTVRDSSPGELPAKESPEQDTPIILKSRHIMALVDPRSPTQEISRTPIAVEEDKPGHRLAYLNPKMAQFKENATPNNSPFIDPRSPSDGFDRTPIRNVKAKDSIMGSTKINFAS